ncbi:potassium-transporting ATPase subunit F [Bacillus mangrovi]|uniref:Potassium-transporting ATPase subunit F n=1 Tax=Metabacillus mangrovi TaxID=1491830 RepID=A0A7X2S4V6_9BACI|nr:potassium-transporting ATPase subunit F [Metabacillus mangrovi]
MGSGVVIVLLIAVLGLSIYLIDALIHPEKY